MRMGNNVCIVMKEYEVPQWDAERAVITKSVLGQWLLPFGQWRRNAIKKDYYAGEIYKNKYEF